MDQHATLEYNSKYFFKLNLKNVNLKKVVRRFIFIFFSIFAFFVLFLFLPGKLEHWISDCNLTSEAATRATKKRWI